MRSLARAALATSSSRKRALLALVAVPPAAALVAGVAIGVGAGSRSAGAIAIAIAVPVAIVGAYLAARALVAATLSVRRTHSAFWIADKVAPLRLDAREDEPRRVDVVHPAIDLKHFFGGFIAVFNLTRRLAERGHRVRLITLEGQGAGSDWRSRLSAYEGIGDAIATLELVEATDRSTPIPINPADALVATHFTAAHVAAGALSHLQASRFLYLIQEYEPFTFPMGSAAAFARASYDLPHSALFSTGLLRDWFAAERLGVFADGRERGEANCATFENAITCVGPVQQEELMRPSPRRLLFYARPEEHASRNLFEIGTMALDNLAAEGRLEGWELLGIGTVELGAGALTLPRSGATVRLVPRTAQSDYAATLRACDVGLALMYTPHPSLVPIEMAAAGMPTVTNTFANKDAGALAAISPNLIAAEPTVAGVAAALTRACASVGDLAGRARGSNVAWPASWDEALADPLLARVEELLGLGARNYI